MNRRLRRALRPTTAVLIHVALRLAPKRDHVVVYGWPSSEPNATEIVRSLGQHYGGKVIWLDGPPDAAGGSHGRLVLMRKNTLRGLVGFLTARLSFISDGLYTFPRPAKRAPIVNLWHGDGPKATLGGLVPSSYLVTSSPVLAEQRRVLFGVPESRLVAVGTPRMNQLSSPLGHAALGRLGIDGTRPFVLWMPTYRRVSTDAPTSGWVDVSGPDRNAEFDRAMARAAALFADEDVQLVVKVHPLDGERQVPGAVVLTGLAMERGGLDLQRLLAASSALITDYSSVWTDYLALDRPIGFFMPDLDEYRTGRGLSPEAVVDHLPGRILDQDETFRGLIREIRGLEDTSELRASTRAWIGFSVAPDPALALLQRLESDGFITLR